jgi:DNA repair protein RadC
MLPVKSENTPNYLTGITTYVEHENDEIIAQAMEVLRRRLERRRPVSYIQGAAMCGQYLQLKLSMETREHFGMLLLDGQNGVIGDEIMFHGGATSCHVHIRELAKLALKVSAMSVVVYHNHPSGRAEPSEADKLLTSEIKIAMRMIDVTVLDHIVVGDGYYSFAEHGLI